ncbi:hypothetical protein, partial [Streptomyces sp. NPDC058621]|uniref:hypothetical protein n=1 Tax=Streptomyces sp. NPDC058621 TaxID=3346561 RepID=UPI00365C56FA
LVREHPAVLVREHPAVLVREHPAVLVCEHLALPSPPVSAYAVDVRSSDDRSARLTRDIPGVTRISPGTGLWAGQQPAFGARSPMAA